MADTGDVMVTGRLTARKKAEGNKVLERMGLNPSQAINLMYDKLIAEGNAEFLGVGRRKPTQQEWAEAFAFVDGLRLPGTDRFEGMTKAEIKRDRLKARGLI